jgi:hypothetical protein
MILNINPLASAQTPTQIATQDISQFNVVASLIHERRTNGIAAVPAVVNQQGQVVQAPRPAVTPEEYVNGLTTAIGQDAYNRLVAASETLIGTEQQPAS